MKDIEKIPNWITDKVELAESCWPRAGGDRANRSHVSIPGPDKGEIIKEIELPIEENEDFFRGVWGCVVTDHNDLRVLYRGVLTALTMEGDLLWYVRLSDIPDMVPGYQLCPVAIKDGGCLVPLENGIVILDNQGKMFSRSIFEKSP